MFVRDKESKKCVIVGDSVLVHACDNILFSTDNLGVCIRKFNTRFDILIICRSGVVVFFPFLFLVSFVTVHYREEGFCRVTDSQRLLLYGETLLIRLHRED